MVSRSGKLQTADELINTIFHTISEAIDLAIKGKSPQEIEKQLRKNNEEQKYNKQEIMKAQ